MPKNDLRPFVQRNTKQALKIMLQKRYRKHIQDRVSKNESRYGVWVESHAVCLCMRVWDVGDPGSGWWWCLHTI